MLKNVEQRELETADREIQHAAYSNVNGGGAELQRPNKGCMRTFMTG